MKFGQTGRGSVLYILAIAGVAIGVYSVVMGIFGGNTVREVSAQQQDPFLSRRVDQMEQRFYQIENRLSRIETQSRPLAITSPILGANDSEIRMLQADISSLRLRLGEAECGLLRVDERTLTPAARAARKKAVAGGTENCRLERDTPVMLSARP